MRKPATLAVLWTSLALSGCLTSAGGALSPLELQAPAGPPEIEYTVGDFEFTLEGGKMVTSNKMGRELSNAIFERWKKRGYISGFSYVPSGEFTGKTPYQMTLSGSQYGDSSVAAQLLSGLTLLILPYTVDSKYDIQYTLEDTRTGARHSAAVADSYHTTVELFLFLAAPVSLRGADQTWTAMGDHIYQQLREQGAFEEQPVAGAGP